MNARCSLEPLYHIRKGLVGSNRNQFVQRIEHGILDKTSGCPSAKLGWLD
jgi:hypothetical protein